MKTWGKGLLPILGIALLAIALLSLACAPAATPTPTPTATRAPATPTPTPTRSAVASPTPTPTTAAASPTPSVKPSGQLVVAMSSVGVPVGTPELCVPGCGNEKFMMSAWDTLTYYTIDDRLVGSVASSWEFAPDLSAITWHIRPGIPFHRGYGELTAEDVAWTFNSINGATNPESRHDNVGDFSASYGETRVVDRYTAETKITNYDARAPAFLFSQYWQGAGIDSKAVFDQYGKEGMKTVFVGTGPYQVLEWIQNDHILLEAVENHWRKTPAVKTVRVVAVPEEAARVAMFESGEAHITRVGLPFVPQLLEKGGVEKKVGTIGNLFSFGAGNYLEKTNQKTGEPLNNPGFDPSLPWVSNPNGSGCDYNVLLQPKPTGTVCEALEKARKVRWALAMAINREAISQALAQGFGKPTYLPWLSPSNPHSKPEWTIPYDPAKAKQFLTEAGYPNGFQMQVYAGEQLGELPQAIASGWEADLGVKVNLVTAPYATIRPTFVDRSNKLPIFDAQTVEWPFDWPVGREDNSWYAGGTMKFGAIPFSGETYGKMLKEPDVNKRIQMATDWYEHTYYWMWQVGLYEAPILAVYNGNYMQWNPQGKTSLWFSLADMYPLEDITLKS